MVVNVATPTRRRLRVYGYDPLGAEISSTIVTVDVPWEPLETGPVGSLLKVVDFDPVADAWYQPVDLNDPLMLAQDGLPPSEADPRFAQQNVYAVGSSVLEHFERALGRRFRFSKPLPMYPHAFRGANAYYDPARRAVLFGSFRADLHTPGTALPGQWVHTALSHDIIAHELTHAIVDRLRPELMSPTNHDVAAFHEGISDLVALFHHFTLPDLVRRHLQASKADIANGGALVELARQFGEASAMGAPLRTGVDKPDPALYAKTFECHDRGAILVGAVFSAFITTYRSRIADLLRLATGGSGELPPGHLHPDLIGRVASEATTHARRFLTICVRAFDYLPIADVTYGDFLRALVTADAAVFPQDSSALRATIIEEFRRRGIYAAGVGSLGESSLRWPVADTDITLDRVSEMIAWAAEDFDDRTLSPAASATRTAARAEARTDMAKRLYRHVEATPGAFGLAKNQGFAIRGFHASFRTSEDGQPRVDIVVCIRQERTDIAELPELAGTGLRIFAGATVVADSLGQISHIISKPLPERADRRRAGPGAERLQSIIDFVAERDAMDNVAPWALRKDRITAALSLSKIHAGRAMTR